MFEVSPYLINTTTERPTNWHPYRPTELDGCDVHPNPLAIPGDGLDPLATLVRALRQIRCGRKLQVPACLPYSSPKNPPDFLSTNTVYHERYTMRRYLCRGAYEGHRNPMTIGRFEERMRGGLTSGEYRAVLFEENHEVVAYALFP